MNDVNFQNFGYPKPSDNARSKPAIIFDTATITTGQTEYVLYNNTTLANATRNKALPLASSEVICIKEIAAYMRTAQVAASAATADLLAASYLQVIINDREVIKLPGFAFIAVDNQLILGQNNQPMLQRKISVARKLRFPIILNGNDAVVIKFVTTAAAATGYNTQPLRFEFKGYKYDKLTGFDWDQIKANRFERLSYTIYDTNTASDAAQVWDLFTTRNKAPNLISKTFPLSNKEAFQIEAISAIYFALEEHSSLNTIIGDIVQNNLLISVNDVDIFNGFTLDMITLLQYNTPTFTDAGAVSTNASFCNTRASVYVVPQESPLIIPADANFKCSLIQPAITNYDQLFSWALHGTLIRGVA